jgi:hypothetical protein
MNTERNYDFRKQLLTVHQAGRRESALQPLPDECCLDDRTEIIIPADADRVLKKAAADLQDYLAVSMDVHVRVRPDADLVRAASSGSGRIVIGTRAHLPDIPLLAGEGSRGCRLDCGDNVVVTGFDSAGACQGSILLEDLMNFRQAPFLRRGTTARKPLFSPRMIHSGFGLDQYPDEHLAAIAHAGLDAILVFVKDVDTTPYGYLDFNDLCYRAAAWGIDVYAYSYLVSQMHPEDDGAAAYYDKIYGSVFAACPAFKGIVMVGESVEFPSRDPHTTGQSHRTPSPDGLPRTKPTPGWWPCQDYPQWVGLVRDTVRRHKADADIVFWTYNWGYVEEKYRIELLEHLPTDITLLVTFEMFEKLKTGPVTSTCVDYTLMFEGPGQYFLSEAKKAKERGIRLYAMVNTGGLTWDIGVIPYEPAPQQWMRRHRAILDCRERYGLCGLMESHHFGFWPSFISDLAKWTYSGADPDETLRRLAERDFGAASADRVLEAWSLWSDGIRHCLSTNEDQYGPFRIGPAFPLVLTRDVMVPESPFAMFGNRIFNTLYGPADSGRSSLLSFRLPVEIEYLTIMRDRFTDGADILDTLVPSLPPRLREQALRQINLGRFISRCAQTTIHVKRWYQHKLRLLSAAQAEDVRIQVEAMRTIAAAEIENARATIPLVQLDSRLGWEPSMEYMCDEAHLRWKIRQVQQMIDTELAMYEKTLAYSEEGDDFA